MRKQVVMMRALFLGLLALGLVALGACPKPVKAPEDGGRPQADFSAGKFSRGAVCKQCHVDIYQFWSVSAHAESFSNRNFQVALQQYRRDAKKKDGRPCLNCHAPLTRFSKEQSRYAEWKPASTLQQEGVACDFCHSVTAVDMKREDPYVVDPGPVKYGPVADASDDEHGTGHKPLFAESKICAGCHEYQKPGSDLHIISTYSEWQASAYAKKGQHCQSCHMKIEPGKIVDAKIKRTDRPVNAHRMPGSHSRAQLRSALKLRIDEVKQVGDQVEVQVSIENKGGGHHIPTGMPTRKLELLLEGATPAGQSFKETRVYKKKLVDAKGLSVDSDSAAFIDAVSIGQDNRIAAGERRVEKFSFKVAHDQELTVRASLVYSYSPQPQNLPEERLAIVQVEKSLAAR